ncbi:cytochrome P450 [Phascolomyces articulosus]|uniref:Cytochrome P450 n=1 Tax=Phascolomyces articulosus TaxID=60185 RepID=A0AAD5K5X2_9FUNG|nr:cytochrome P450 [Phascolomyces articulosus]
MQHYIDIGAIILLGHDVLLNVWVNHHDSDFQKDSNGNHYKFDPFRHLSASRPASKIGNDYLVFGEGKHACPGRWFAIQEVKTIVTLLIRSYKLEAKDPINFPLINARMPTNARVTIQRRAL